jgi:hypothetical protein
MDPRVAETQVGPQTRKANLSRLMAAKTRASTGEKVNFCPFGCEMDDLDEQGHCRHLIGYTTDGKHMEPLLEVRGRRTVQVRKDAEGRPVLEKIPTGAVLERITISSRVYHAGEARPAKAKA